jgi:hypothetical protein
MSFPETIPTKLGAFATYIVARKPEFKAHTNIGHAKNAFDTHYGYYNGAIREYTPGKFSQDMALYQLAMDDTGSVWKLHTVVKKDTTKEDYPELWKSKTTKGDK